jgi:atlastin
MKGEALQIVSSGDDGFHVTSALADILSKVPADCTVSVVSVVGAFRTGKSFLLSLFLRYLRLAPESRQGLPTDTQWLYAEGTVDVMQYMYYYYVMFCL